MKLWCSPPVYPCKVVGNNLWYAEHYFKFRNTKTNRRRPVIPRTDDAPSICSQLSIGTNQHKSLINFKNDFESVRALAAAPSSRQNREMFAHVQIVIAINLSLATHNTRPYRCEGALFSHLSERNRRP